MSLIYSFLSTVFFLLIIAFMQIIVDGIKRIIRKLLSIFLGSKLSIFILNYGTFIGTIHHELSHAIFALLTGAKIVSAKLFTINKYKLGSVTYRLRGNILSKAIQQTIVSMAPLLTALPTSYMLYKYGYKATDSRMLHIIIIYIIASIILQSSMSDKDIRVLKEKLHINISIISIFIWLISIIIIQIKLQLGV